MVDRNRLHRTHHDAVPTRLCGTKELVRYFKRAQQFTSQLLHGIDGTNFCQVISVSEHQFTLGNGDAFLCIAKRIFRIGDPEFCKSLTEGDEHRIIATRCLYRTRSILRNAGIVIRTAKAPRHVNASIISVQEDNRRPLMRAYPL